MFDIISSLANHSLTETGVENLEQSLYLFYGFEFGIHLSIMHVSIYRLMPVTFYPSVVILQDGG